MKAFKMERFKIADILPQAIHLDAIDVNPGPFCMSYGFDVARLSESIRRVGLINSPIVIQTGEGGGKIEYAVVAGFRRIIALKSMEAGRVPCRILPPETTPFACLLINLYENLTLRDFNPVEKGMALTRLLRWVPAKEVTKTFMPLFDLPSHEETLRLFEGIETKFEAWAKDLLANGHLSTQGAKLLLEMDKAARERFCRFFSLVKFSKNQQAQFIEFINDLSHIEKKTVTQLLDDPQLVGIRDSAPMNTPQKVKALIKILRTRRLPHLVQAEKSFKRMVEKLALPPHYRITPPPFFEGPHYRLDISFTNGGDLTEKLSILLEKEGIAALGDPWSKGI